MWLNTYFSLSGLTTKFLDCQKVGLKAVQVGKIIETDSPHLVMRGADVRGELPHNSPMYFGAVARMISAIMEEGPGDVLEAIYYNAMNFLQLLLRYVESVGNIQKGGGGGAVRGKVIG